MAQKGLQKTNAMRLLTERGTAFEVLTYEAKEALDGVTVAEKLGLPPENVFKTLVTTAASGAHYVFDIPACEELDRKKAARAAGEKSIDMVHVKELLPLTGYVRGGCSPLGMKKEFPTFIHESASSLPYIVISGGRIGLQLKLAPAELAAVIGARFADLTV